MAPAELEAIILSHQAVRDVAVVGIPDLESGELPRAYVVLQANKALATEELDIYLAGHHIDTWRIVILEFLFILGRVAAFKRLKGGIEFLEEIPKSPNGKILRRVLKQRYIHEKEKKSKL